MNHDWDIEHLPPESWSATNELRWFNRWISDEQGYLHVLQQRWQGSQGGSKWEDVPVVKEGEDD